MTRSAARRANMNAREFADRPSGYQSHSENSARELCLASRPKERRGMFEVETNWALVAELFNRGRYS